MISFSSALGLFKKDAMQITGFGDFWVQQSETVRIDIEKP